MTIRDSIEIRAPVNQVWRWVSDPTRLGSWNPKVTRVDKLSGDLQGEGARYRVRYRMGQRTTSFIGELEVYRVPEEVVLRLTEGNLRTGGLVRERFKLRPSGDGTLLTRTIDLGESRIALPWRFLFGLLHRLGKPVNKPYLARLRDVIEADP